MPVPTFVAETALLFSPSKALSTRKKRKFGDGQPTTINSSPVPDGKDPKASMRRSPKRRRQQRTSPASYGKAQSTSPNTQHPPSPTKVGTLLSSCHICHRRPKTKPDLPGYADCDNCSRRTCYICMRECEETNCKLAAYTCQADQPTTDAEPRKQVSEAKGRRQRLCRDCTVESVYEDGTDMIRCLHCAEGETMWNSTRSSGELQPP